MTVFTGGLRFRFPMAPYIYTSIYTSIPAGTEVPEVNNDILKINQKYQIFSAFAPFSLYYSSHTQATASTVCHTPTQIEIIKRIKIIPLTSRSPTTFIFISLPKASRWVGLNIIRIHH
jgi:hypothetical protein